MHFCLAKGANGSPNLWNSAFTEENIDEEMAERARVFLANEKKGLHLDKYALLLSRSF